MSRRTSRLVPFLIALTICAFSSVVLGFSAWILFGKNPAVAANKAPKVLEGSQPIAVPSRTEAPSGEQPKESPPPSNTVSVAAGTVELGGDKKNPARKVAVENFYIADTEVTNQLYQDFVKEANAKAPVGWKDGEFPAGSANKPVTDVTWQDAVDFCKWYSTKTGLTVRLPSEAEWELAAHGPQNTKFPWGNDWDDRAAASDGDSGFVHAVKSYPAGRAACGAYDLAGNVWEWVSDSFDPEGKLVSEGDAPDRVIKGGAANENRVQITATSRSVVHKDSSSAFLGFRYVIVKN